MAPEALPASGLSAFCCLGADKMTSLEHLKTLSYARLVPMCNPVFTLPKVTNTLCGQMLGLVVRKFSI